jgi:hypothetical protein
MSADQGNATAQAKVDEIFEVLEAAAKDGGDNAAI